MSLAHREADADTNWLIFAIRSRLRKASLQLLGVPLDTIERTEDEINDAPASRNYQSRERTIPAASVYSLPTQRNRSRRFMLQDFISTTSDPLFDICAEDRDGRSAYAHAVQWGDQSVLVALHLYNGQKWWPHQWTGVLEARIRRSAPQDIDQLHCALQVRWRLVYHVNHACINSDEFLVSFALRHT